MDHLSDQRPARRMRLGTKSCAECRRRKVRCVFPPNSSVCHGCSLHQTPCRAQQPRLKDGSRPGQAQVPGQLQAHVPGQVPGQLQSLPQSQSLPHSLSLSPSPSLPLPPSLSQLATDNAALRQRVTELEDLICSLCDALEPSGDDMESCVSASASASASAADINSRAIQVIKNLKSRGFLRPGSGSGYGFGTALADPNMPLPPDPPSSSLLLSPSSLDQDSSSTPSDYPDKAISAVDAPLIHLFRDALMIRESEGELYDDPEDPSLVYLMKESITSFRPPIPDTETLHLMLQDTYMFWPIWPTYYYGPDLSNTMHATSLDAAKAYITQILTYSRGVEFCTAMLFLTLCIQQLPRHWKRAIISPNISRQVLIDAYIRFACVLLSVQGEESADVVQCYLLLHKILINMGRPQRAWVAARHAISTATVIGLDRLDAGASFQRKILWVQAWQVERHLCLMLGFPSAITTLGTKDDLAMFHMLTPTQSIVRRVCIIMGRVIERNQNSATASYAATVQLDQDMEELKAGFPPEWSEAYGPEETAHSIYHQTAAKIFYFSTLKHIHLPYMLKAKSDRRYEHSRLSTMEACRELVKAYLRLRGCPRSELIQCELMDFLIFSSAITLILGVLCGVTASERPPPPPLSYYTEEWQLVERLIAELRKTNALLECTIARQSAEVLETLMAASYGSYNVRDDFTLVVPYFGRLRISRAGGQGAHGDSIGGSITGGSITGGSITGGSITGGSITGGSQNASSLTSPSVTSCVALSSLPPKQMPGDPYYVPQPANTIEFSSNEFLNTTFSDFDFQMDLSQDWCAIADTGAQYDWNQMFNTTSMDLR
ncbi:hypothetical protein V8C37DRAFT_376546 [Trichoderma ceciliae]